MTSAARILYVALLWLHPPAFRQEFAAEMLCLFDEAAETYSACWLLGEAAVSLLRQWFLRPGQAQIAAAAQAPFSLLAGVYPVRKAPHLTAAKLAGALALTLLSVFLFPPREAVQRHSGRSAKPARMEARNATDPNR